MRIEEGGLRFDGGVVDSVEGQAGRRRPRYRLGEGGDAFEVGGKGRRKEAQQVGSAHGDGDDEQASLLVHHFLVEAALSQDSTRC